MISCGAALRGPKLGGAGADLSPGAVPGIALLDQTPGRLPERLQPLAGEAKWHRRIVRGWPDGSLPPSSRSSVARAWASRGCCALSAPGEIDEVMLTRTTVATTAVESPPAPS